MAKISALLCCLGLIAGTVQSASVSSNSFANYLKRRDAFFEDEFSRGLGASLRLDAKESRLNAYVMQLKERELTNGLSDPTTFTPAFHFFEVVDQINESELFHLLRKMPKGGVLHAHDTALCNLDFFVQLTYWDHLWQVTDSATGIPQFRFSRTQPAEQWTLVRAERESRGAQAYDTELRRMASLYSENPLTDNRDVNAIWGRFMEIFGLTDGIMMYRDAWEAYYLQALKEFSADQVDYLELRSTLPQVSGRVIR